MFLSMGMKCSLCEILTVYRTMIRYIDVPYRWDVFFIAKPGLTRALYTLYIIIVALWAGHVAHIWERRGEYSVLMGKPERRRWEDNIKIGIREL